MTAVTISTTHERTIFELAAVRKIIIRAGILVNITFIDLVGDDQIVS